MSEKTDILRDLNLLSFKIINNYVFLKLKHNCFSQHIKNLKSWSFQNQPFVPNQPNLKENYQPGFCPKPGFKLNSVSGIGHK
jgi:hypothetical protein